MKITKEDIGRKVRIKDGRTGIIRVKDQGQAEYPYSICNFKDESFVYCHVDTNGHSEEKNTYYYVEEFIHDSKETEQEVSLSRAIKETKALTNKLNSIECGEASARTLGLTIDLYPELDQVSLREGHVDRSDLIGYLKELIEILES